MKANGDGYRPGRSDRRAEKDLEFLTELRAAVEAKSVVTLKRLAANHSHKKAPGWRKVALQRAFAKLGLPSPV